MENKQLPEHVAIIMDGNGRWAKQHNLSRNKGHKKGAEVLKKISKYADKIGIKCITVYAFSTENWNRPQEEVDGLMGLLRDYLDSYLKDIKKQNIRIRILGDIEGLPQDIQEKVAKLHKLSENTTGLCMNMAINYGGRDELVRAFKKIAKRLEDNHFSIDQIDEDMITNCLDTATLPDPDLMIRTSGEIRTSNFLPWQLAYSEFYFTPCLWPDFTTKEFDEAIEAYNQRKRRFGKSE